MFGNGNGNGQQEIIAPDTKSLWGEMFGLGPFFKVITDPALGRNAQAMMIAITQGAQASNRIEQKLDILLRAQGYELDANGLPIARAAALDRADGTGGSAAPGLDPGNGADQAAGDVNGAAKPPGGA